MENNPVYLCNNSAYMEYGMECDDLQVTAKLALLDLQEDELESLAAEFTRMLEYMSKMDEIDAAALEPTTRVLSSAAHLRDDIPKKNAVQREALLSQAPQTIGTSILIPRVLP